MPGGEVIGCGAAVADLGDQRRGEDHALGVAEQRQEDRAVRVGADGVRDLGGEQPDLCDERAEGGDERDRDLAAARVGNAALRRERERRPICVGGVDWR